MVQVLGFAVSRMSFASSIALHLDEELVQRWSDFVLLKH